MEEKNTQKQFKRNAIMENNNSPFLTDYEVVDEFETMTDFNNEIEENYFSNEFDYENTEFESPFFLGDSTNNSANYGLSNRPSNQNFELDFETTEVLFRELKDEEFNKAIYDVASHIRTQIQTPFLLNEFEQQDSPRGIAEQYVSPLRFEIENYFNHLESQVGDRDIRSISDNEIENLFDGYYSEGETLDEKQEFLFKKIKDKARNAVKSTKKAAKKKGKGIFLKKIMGVLGKIVKPLLDKVIQLGINKLPADIQPIAIELKNKIFRRVNIQTNDDSQEQVDTTENSPFVDNSTTIVQNTIQQASTDETEGDSSAEADPEAIPAPEDIQEEFNANFVQMLMANEYEHQQILDNYLAENEADESFSNQEFFMSELDYETSNDIETARQNFIYELSNLQEGESPQPAIENFLPIVLKAAKPALKMALKVIGREKIINTVSKLAAKLISKFIGEEKALKLATHLVDAGFKKFLNFEMEYETNDGQIAYEAIADVVQEVARKVSNFSEESLMNEELLTRETQLAFEQAAAAIFPDKLIKHEAREAQNTNGVWQSVQMPNGERKYRKYSQVFEVVLSKNKLKYIKTFGGERLEAFLTEKMSVSLDGQTAQVHLYEAMPNCMLSEIAVNETAIASLGTGGEESYAQIHPLTPVAAAVLLNEVGLASDDDDKYLQSRDKIKEGQRFFVLEIAGVGRVKTLNYDNNFNSSVNSSNNVVAQTRIISGLREKIVRIATSELGYVEGKGNFTKYNDWYNGQNGYPWCATFVSWVYNQAGIPLKGVQTSKGFAGTVYGLEQFKKRGEVTTKPEAGDIVFFYFGGKQKPQHVGIFVSNNSDGRTINTIEGNTSGDNSGSQSNGGGVYKKKRAISSVVAFVKPNVLNNLNNYIFNENSTHENTGNSNLQNDNSFQINSKVVNINKGVLQLIGEGNFAKSKREYGVLLPHWPGYNSGITIGFGYDLGARFKSSQKSLAYKEMVEAGFNNSLASKLSNAVGIQGKNAQNIEKQYSGDFITAEHALRLLQKTRASYKSYYMKDLMKFQNKLNKSVFDIIDEALCYMAYAQPTTFTKNYLRKILQTIGQEQNSNTLLERLSEVIKPFNSSVKTGIIISTYINECMKYGVDNIRFITEATHPKELFKPDNYTSDFVNRVSSKVEGRGPKNIKAQLKKLGY